MTTVLIVRRDSARHVFRSNVSTTGQRWGISTNGMGGRGRLQVTVPHPTNDQRHGYVSWSRSSWNLLPGHCGLVTASLRSVLTWPTESIRFA